MTNQAANAQMTTAREWSASWFGLRRCFGIRHSSFVVFHRQQYMNRCAFSDFAFGVDASSVKLRDVFHNGQPQPVSSNIFGGARFIDAIKPLENARQIFFADADPVIADAQDNFTGALPSCQPDLVT